jgi:hypothetical protein
MTREDKLWEAHDKEGRKLFGKKRWDNANFGWYQEDNLITSKVYGRHPKTLTTFAHKDGSFEHSEEDYN